MKGIVCGAEISEPLAGVLINELDSEDNLITSYASSEEGEYTVSEQAQSLTFQKEGYVNKQVLAPFPEKVRLLNDAAIGYLDKLNWYPGDSINIHIHSSHHYSLKVFRHGNNKDLLWESEPFPASPQQVPDGNFVETGLDWSVATTYTIPASAQPGLYSILIQNGTDPDFAIPLAISTPAKARNSNKLLVMASTGNWLSYNIWGGRSRYRNFETVSPSQDFINPTFKEKIKSRLKESLSPDQRAKVRKLLRLKSIEPSWKFDRLAVQRPFTNCDLEGPDVSEPFINHLAGGEWRILAWLEREGIAYDYVTSFELDQDPDLLIGYKGLILSTHCEYWSKPMYEGLKKAHNEHNLWIVNLGGNSIFREIEFDPDGSQRCVSLSFADSVADETETIGVRYNEYDYGTAAPFKAMQLNHWVYDGVPLQKSNPLFGTQSLNRNIARRSHRYDPGRPGLEAGIQGQGASGWETDKRAHGTPKDMVLVAKGQNKGGGADMLVREPADTRGGVFTASSITFGGALLIDDICSGIVKNVLTRVITSS